MDAETNRILAEHRAIYPGMEAEDCIKLLYQGELGGGHLIGDEKEFTARLAREMAQPGLFTAAPYGLEAVGGGLCRVYLSALENGPCAETLARLCILSAGPRGSEERLRQKLADLRDGLAGEQAAVVEAYLAQPTLAQPRHSPRYRALYQPHYRLVTCRMAFYLPVFAAIDKALAQRPHVLVGIDGMSASGKSSLAGVLAQVYHCGVAHADDFFLQPHQRTAQRLAQPGGNVDYERLAPVAAQAGEDRAFTYRAYDCQTGEMGEERAIPAARLTVLEGAYCLHPKVAAPCDVRVFLGVDAAVQQARVLARSGEALARRFREEWIPMENAYISAFGVRQGCDVVLDTTEAAFM